MVRLFVRPLRLHQGFLYVHIFAGDLVLGYFLVLVL